MKTCKKCANTLPVTGFYRHPETADGYLNYCKDCVRERINTRRQCNPNAERERDRKRGFRVYDVGKVSARAELYNAVRRGSVTRDLCWCGKRAEGHHDDYSKPLIVRWLCKKHHLELHRKSA